MQALSPSFLKGRGPPLLRSHGVNERHPPPLFSSSDSADDKWCISSLSKRAQIPGYYYYNNFQVIKYQYCSDFLATPLSSSLRSHIAKVTTNELHHRFLVKFGNFGKEKTRSFDMSTYVIHQDEGSFHRSNFRNFAWAKCREEDSSLRIRTNLLDWNGWQKYIMFYTFSRIKAPKTLYCLFPLLSS